MPNASGFGVKFSDTASAIIPTLPIVIDKLLPVTTTATSESGPDVAKGNADIASNPKPVSYTHLTLPTILRV